MTENFKRLTTFFLNRLIILYNLYYFNRYTMPIYNLNNTSLAIKVDISFVLFCRACWKAHSLRHSIFCYTNRVMRYSNYSYLLSNFNSSNEQKKLLNFK